MVTTDTRATPNKDAVTMTELACDLVVIEHRLRDLRRFTSATAHEHLDAALFSVATTLDTLHAEHDARRPAVHDATAQAG